MPAMLRRPLHWFVVALARLVRWGFYRRVDVAGLERLPSGSPVLVVANHYNGLIDAVLLVATLGRLPRFVAKSGLGANPLARMGLRALGVVLVRRPEDGTTAGDGAANAAMFRETSHALTQGHMVVIFPEGTTHDEPSLARIRTGAARMALMAHGHGARHLVIAPIGITYHDKISVRSSALVALGAVIPVERFAVASADPLEHDAVVSLTAAIDHRLRAVSPDFDDAIEWRSAELAADLYLRTDRDRAPAFERRDAVVRQLQAMTPDTRNATLDVVATYVLALQASGLDDDMVLGDDTIRRSLRPLVIAALVLTVLAPLATFGLTVNAIPIGLTMASGLLTAKPFMKGTFRAATALVTFPVAWTVAAINLADPFLRQLGIAALCLLGLVVVVATFESALLLLEAALDWRRSLERRVPIRAMRDRRATMVADLEAALTTET